MYLIAMTRFSAFCTFEAELPVLASALGLAPYDARLKLSAPLPIVLGSAFELERTRELVAALRQRGHGIIACELASVPREDSALHARGFELQRDAVALHDAHGAQVRVPYAQLLGIFRASEVTTAVETREVKRQKLAIGRAVLTGGVLRRKSVVGTETHETSERQEALYLFRSTATDPIVLRERDLDYRGLGEHRGATRRESFAVLIEWLRRAAPGAIYDERLLLAKRRPTLSAVEGLGSRRLVTNSNAGANQLAAYLLMHGHLHGQL